MTKPHVAELLAFRTVFNPASETQGNRAMLAMGLFGAPVVIVAAGVNTVTS